jgi:hypothetical protein
MTKRRLPTSPAICSWNLATNPWNVAARRRRKRRAGSAEREAPSAKRRAQSGERFALPASRLAQGWPCYFFKSDTTGEKEFEEFFAQGERLVLDRFWPQSGSEDVRRPGGGGLRTEDGRRGTRLEALETLCHTIGSKLGKMMQKPDSFS